MKRASRSRTTAGLRRHPRTNAQGRQFYERRSVDQKTLPIRPALFASLNDQQKRRLTEELVHIINERDVN